jgi:hypothetical protein
VGFDYKKVYTGKRPQTLRVEGMYQTQATVAMEPRNNESKTRTTPQRERSHTPKVTRGLREHMSDSDQTLRPPRKMNIEKVKNDFLPRSQPLFCQGLQCLQSIAPATKIEPEASEVPHLLHGIINMAQIKFDDSFTKGDFRPFRNVIQVHQTLRLPQKIRERVVMGGEVVKVLIL